MISNIPINFRNRFLLISLNAFGDRKGDVEDSRFRIFLSANDTP